MPNQFKQSSNSKSGTQLMIAEWFWILFLTMLSALVISPWGEFPINDDWTFSHIAKQFVESGIITVDAPSAPNAIFQIVLGAAWIKLVGFSHVGLRILSVLFSLVFLFCLRSALKSFGFSFWVRVFLLTNMAWNPLFLHFQWSFMTEIYGYTLMMLSLVIWLKALKKEQETGSVQTFQKGLAIVIVASAFWARQYCVLLLPAYFLDEWFRKPKINRRVFFKRWAVYTAISVALVGSYFVWARATGNYKFHFMLAMRELPLPKVGAWFKHTQIFSFYILFFLLPLCTFVLPQWPKFFKRKFYNPLTVVYLITIVVATPLWWIRGSQGYWPREMLNRIMPYLGNVLNPMGIGPVTTTDVYLEFRSQLMPLHYGWFGMTIALLLLCPFLVLAVRSAMASSSRRKTQLGSAIPIFAILISLFASVQSAYGGVFDRYYFPAYLFSLFIAAQMIRNEVGLVNKKTLKKMAVTICIVQAVMGAYALLATRDYFSWNKVRYELVQVAKDRGIFSQLDGGFEVNAWHHHEGTPAEKSLRASCGQAQDYFCFNYPYQIAWTNTPNGKILEERDVSTVLVHFPTLKLIQK